METDFIFAAVTEEMGLLFSVSLLVVCICCFLQMMRIALGNTRRMARNHVSVQQDRFYRLLASGFGVMYIFQVFLTVGGGIRFIPLTGVTLPLLVSYGGSSVMTTLFLFAAVQGAGLKRRAPFPEDDGEDWDEEDDDEWREEEEDVNEWEAEDEASYRGQSHGGNGRSGRKGW